MSGFTVKMHQILCIDYKITDLVFATQLPNMKPKCFWLICIIYLFD